MMLVLLLIVTMAGAPREDPRADPFGRCLHGARARSGEFPAILDCYVAAYAREDARLNVEYRSAMHRLSRPRRSHLVLAERRWVADRDRRCAAEIEAANETDSQDGRLAELSCLIDRTQRRSDRLRRMR